MTDNKKQGWFSRLTQGLSKTSNQISDSVVSVFTANKTIDAAALEELEDMLVESDFGPQIAASIAAKLAERKFASTDDVSVKTALAEIIAEELKGREDIFDPLSGPKPYVVLFVGVNGSGKTTTLGKIAARLTAQKAKVMIVACDTFRAAAVEQLKVWAERAGADFFGRKTGSDAAGLAYDAVV
ncbi:MAG: signal recognition particle receptor subunit alpha, partial [Asticcacaulis sp.]